MVDCSYLCFHRLPINYCQKERKKKDTNDILFNPKYYQYVIGIKITVFF